MPTWRFQEDAVPNVPTAGGLLVCEQVIIDKRTDNVTPVNCFTLRWSGSRRNRNAFPCSRY